MGADRELHDEGDAAARTRRSTRRRRSRRSRPPTTPRSRPRTRRSTARRSKTVQRLMLTQAAAFHTMIASNQNVAPKNLHGRRLDPHRRPAIRRRVLRLGRRRHRQRPNATRGGGPDVPRRLCLMRFLTPILSLVARPARDLRDHLRDRVRPARRRRRDPGRQARRPHLRGAAGARRRRAQASSASTSRCRCSSRSGSRRRSRATSARRRAAARSARRSSERIVPVARARARRRCWSRCRSRRCSPSAPCAGGNASSRP